MAYRDEVVADLPLRYFRLGGTGAATDEMGSGAALSFGAATAAPTRNVTGALTGVQNDGAIQFDGVNDTATVPLNLSTTAIITIECWLWWDAFADNDKLLMEFTANSNSNAGAFIVNPNGSGVGSTFHFAHNGSTVSQAASGNFARPSAAAWHHIVLVLNRNGAAVSDHAKAYVDGAAVAVTNVVNTLSSTIGNGNFGNSTLYLMHRSTPALWGAGRLDELAVYTSELSAARVLAHYNAGLAGTTQVSATRRVNYAVQAQVAATRRVAYNVLANVAATRRITYAVQAAVSATRRVRYDVLAAVAATRRVGYIVGTTQVAATRRVAYSVQAQVAQTKRVVYGVLAQVAATRSIAYGVNQAVLATRRTNYTVQANVTGRRPIIYFVGTAQVISYIRLGAQEGVLTPLVPTVTVYH